MTSYEVALLRFVRYSSKSCFCFAAVAATTEKIAAAAAVDARSLIGILAALEALGLVRRDAGTWRKVTARRVAGVTGGVTP